MKKLFLLAVFFLFSFSNLSADTIYFVDFKKVLNNSKAGASAQENLKKKYTNESNKFIQEEKNIRKEEAEIISKKKTITNEEYKKKVETLREKVSSLQKKKQESFKNMQKTRNDAKQLLLKSVNPILKKYMEDNNIRLVVDKQMVLMGDTQLEITDQIITILNKELKSLQIK
tara:strand:+ start:1908 stop:2423 length:516 start_codon:yes stop_codon:yes gene_type:complete